MPMGKMYKPIFIKRKPGAIKKRRAAKAKAKAKANTNFRKKVSKVITSRRESKYCPVWYNYDDNDPAQLGPFDLGPVLASNFLPNAYSAASGRVTCVGFQTGHYLNSASTQVNTLIGANTMNSIGGFGMERGDTATTLDGNYAYLHSSHISLTISALVADTNFDNLNAAMTPLEFRVMHIRAKNDHAAGTTPSLTTGMFSDLANFPNGLNDDATKKELFTDWTINTNRFKKLHEVRFKLSQPMQPGFNLALPCAVGNSGSPNLSYPIKKNLKFYLEKPTKQLKFATDDNGATNRYEPINHNFVDYIVILCSRDYGPMTGTAQGQTQYNQTGKDWQVCATGQTKYKDC